MIASERRLEELRTDCGCRVGAWAVLLALVGYGVRVWLEPTSRTWGARLAAGAGVALAAAVAGKVAGIAWARFRYWRLARRLGGRSSPPAAPRPTGVRSL